MILEHGETQTFAPFDREGFVNEHDDTSLPPLLDEFARRRSENLDQLRDGTCSHRTSNVADNIPPSEPSPCRSY